MSIGHAPVAVGNVGSRLVIIPVLPSELAAPEELLEVADVGLDIPDEDAAPELPEAPELPPEDGPAGDACEEPAEEEPVEELLVSGAASPGNGSLPSSIVPLQPGTTRDQ